MAIGWAPVHTLAPIRPLYRHGMETTPASKLVNGRFLLISAASFFYFASIGATLPVMPLFVEGPLGRGNIAVGVVAGSFSIAAVLFRPVSGMIGDRRGRRILIVGGGALAAVSIAILPLLDSIVPVVIARIANGIGEAFFFTGAVSAITDIAPAERRGEAMSLFSVTLYGGLALGPLAGEWLKGSYGFDAVWIASGAVGILAAVFGTMLPSLVPAGVSSKSRLIHPAGIGPGLVLMCSVWAFAGFSSFLPLYAKQLGMQGSGPLFFIYSFFILLVRLLGAKIPDRLGFIRTIAISLGFTVGGMLLMGTLGSVPGLYIATAVLGVGQSLAAPALIALAAQGVPQAETGAALGTTTAFLDIGFGIGPLTLGFVADQMGYRAVWLAAAMVGLAGIAILQVVKRPDRSAVI